MFERVVAKKKKKYFDYSIIITVYYNGLKVTFDTNNVVGRF